MCVNIYIYIYVYIYICIYIYMYVNIYMYIYIICLVFIDIDISIAVLSSHVPASGHVLTQLLQLGSFRSGLGISRSQLRRIFLGELWFTVEGFSGLVGLW